MLARLTTRLEAFLVEWLSAPTVQRSDNCAAGIVRRGRGAGAIVRYSTVARRHNERVFASSSGRVRRERSTSRRLARRHDERVFFVFHHLILCHEPGDHVDLNLMEGWSVKGLPHRVVPYPARAGTIRQLRSYRYSAQSDDASTTTTSTTSTGWQGAGGGTTSLDVVR